MKRSDTTRGPWKWKRAVLLERKKDIMFSLEKNASLVLAYNGVLGNGMSSYLE